MEGSGEWERQRALEVVFSPLHLARIGSIFYSEGKRKFQKWKRKEKKEGGQKGRGERGRERKKREKRKGKRKG